MSLVPLASEQTDFNPRTFVLKPVSLAAPPTDGGAAAAVNEALGTGASDWCVLKKQRTFA